MSKKGSKGVTLYIISSILFAVLATVNYVRWAIEKKRI